LVDENIQINGGRADKNEKNKTKKRKGVPIEISKLTGGERTQMKNKNKRCFVDSNIKKYEGRADKKEDFDEQKKKKRKFLTNQNTKTGFCR